MQEDRDHKGFLDRVRSFIIEDVPVDSEEEQAPQDGGRVFIDPAISKGGNSPRAGADDVDRMFADIESEVSGGKKAQAPVQSVTPADVTAPVSANVPDGEVLPPDVKRVIKIIDSLPQVLTKEQVMPILAATMDAANIDAASVVAQLDDSKRKATESIALAQQEIARVEQDCEETLSKLQKLMEAARSQTTENVAAQQKRIGELNAALATLERVGGYLGNTPASNATEIKK